jgi:hypothetical protein
LKREGTMRKRKARQEGGMRSELPTEGFRELP